MRRLLPCLLILVACSDEPSGTAAGNMPARLSIAGELENPAIAEASGIAASQRAADLLWLHNDSGAKAHLYAVSTGGEQRGRIKLEGADNRDWEDIASFRRDGTSFLVAADIGDNESKHDYLTLYVIEEPDLGDDHKPDLEPAWTIDFRYPEGPRDAEAMAVDVENDRILVLTKRDIPARLYGIPLQPAEISGPREPVVATLLGPVSTLPQPTRSDIEYAQELDNWHWQPTAMDVAPDGSAVAILTYSAVYYFPREPGEDIVDCLRKLPLRFSTKSIRDAESVAFSLDGKTIFVTVEKRNAPLLRIDLEPS